MDQPIDQLAMPFYDAATEEMKIAAQRVLREHPEVRSIITIFDYHGDLNDAKIPHAAWFGNGPNGRADTPDAIIGAGYQAMKLLHAIIERTMAWQRAREKQVLDASKRLLQLEQTIAKTKDEIFETDRTPQGTAGVSATESQGGPC